MSPNFARGNVVSLASVRATRRPGNEHKRRSRTVILQASNLQADREVHRHIGVKDSLKLADLHEVIDVCFSPDPANPWQETPWSFQRGEQALDSSDAIHQHLSGEHDQISYHWGLWVIRLHTVGAYPRDRGTPRALCVGGSGSFGQEDFDLAAINAALTGTETIRNVLASTRVEVRDLIRRSEIFDFVPLLQALDLGRPTGLSEETVHVCERLPVEDDQASQDAFWTVVLALSCMSDEALAAEVLETTMQALGWVDDDGSQLSGRAVRGMCPESLVELATIGAYGVDALAPVDRLDIYRELLRA